MTEKKITAHTDGGAITIEGVTFTCIHRGQKRACGDSIYEYKVTSGMDAEHVEHICRTRAYKCDLPSSKYLEEYRAKDLKFSDLFRNHYEFHHKGGGEYFYRVTSPYAD